MPSKFKKTISLCADDYGLSPAVGDGIRQLIEDGRISATNCMTCSPFWPAESDLLRPLADRAEIGLHFTLTALSPLGEMPKLAPRGRFPSLGLLFRKAFMRRLDQGEIEAELSRQIDAFEINLKRRPDFLDGHQHVHLLPTVRDAVLKVMRGRLKGAWLRDCWEPASAIRKTGVATAKAMFLASLSRNLHLKAKRLGIPTNQGFRGVHDFSGRVPYGALFQRFLQDIPEGGLIMCHPGRVDEALSAVDSLTDGRLEELDYFLSVEFPDAVEMADTALGRLETRPRLR
jgi:predicted glycoside hydrolase/deacetylase ChbG (UPF0249 family)